MSRHHRTRTATTATEPAAEHAAALRRADLAAALLLDHAAVAAVLDADADDELDDPAGLAAALAALTRLRVPVLHPLLLVLAQAGGEHDLLPAVAVALVVQLAADAHARRDRRAPRPARPDHRPDRRAA